MVAGVGRGGKSRVPATCIPAASHAGGPSGPGSAAGGAGCSRPQAGQRTGRPAASPATGNCSPQEQLICTGMVTSPGARASGRQEAVHDDGAGHMPPPEYAAAVGAARRHLQGGPGGRFACSPTETFTSSTRGSLRSTFTVSRVWSWALLPARSVASTRTWNSNSPCGTLHLHVPVFSTPAWSTFHSASAPALVE